MKTGMVLVICALMVVSMTILVSDTWAKKPPDTGKPPKPGAYTRYCCYAKVVETTGNVILSDGSPYYSDPGAEEFGTDKIQVETYDDTGELKFLRVYIGKMELPYRSESRVNFAFDLYDSEAPALGQAVYYSLIWLPPIAAGGRRGNYDEDNNAWRLSDGTADPNDTPTPISQTTLDLFYDNSIEYWTPMQATMEKDDPNFPKSWKRHEQVDPHDQIGYFLYESQLVGDQLISQLNFTRIGSSTWSITPKDADSAMVYAMSADNRMRYDLASYSIPFEIRVSLDLSFPVGNSQPAPARKRNLSTTWGEMKAE